LVDRWAQEDDLLAETPRDLDAKPRWMTEKLDGYAPGSPQPETMDDVPPADL
jgi:hypothetical protein